MSPRARRLAAVGIGLAVSAVFLYVVLRRVPLSKAFAEMARVNLAILACALLTRFGAFVFMTARSVVLMRPVAPISAPTLFRSVLLGFAANNVLPARLGELVRVDYLARRSGAPHSACLAVVGFERVVDAFCLVLLFACALPFLLGRVSLGYGVLLLAGAAALALAASILVSHHPETFVRIGRRLAGVFGRTVADLAAPRLERFATGLAALTRTRSVAAVIALSLGFWAMSMASIEVWILAFGFHLPWFAPLVVLVFISMGTLLPAAPSFVGTYEYFATTALALLGLGATDATSLAILGHVVAVVPFTLLALPILLPDLARRRREAALGAPV